MRNKLITPLLDGLNQTKMRTQKIYRILLTDRDSMFTDIALDAAVSNGSKYVSINQLAEVAKGMCRKYPSTGSCHTVNVIGNVLTIDKETENVLIIEEVEVVDLEMPQISAQEAKDLIEAAKDEAPTLNRNTGLADEQHEHLLN